MKAENTEHRWRFFRVGGIDQVKLDSTADLVNLENLDPKLWVALSCPVQGLEPFALRRRQRLWVWNPSQCMRPLTHFHYTPALPQRASKLERRQMQLQPIWMPSPCCRLLNAATVTVCIPAMDFCLRTPNSRNVVWQKG